VERELLRLDEQSEFFQEINLSWSGEASASSNLAQMERSPGSPPNPLENTQGTAASFTKAP